MCRRRILVHVASKFSSIHGMKWNPSGEQIVCSIGISRDDSCPFLRAIAHHPALLETVGDSRHTPSRHASSLVGISILRFDRRRKVTKRDIHDASGMGSEDGMHLHGFPLCAYSSSTVEIITKKIIFCDLNISTKYCIRKSSRHHLVGMVLI